MPLPPPPPQYFFMYVETKFLSVPFSKLSWQSLPTQIKFLLVRVSVKD